MTKNANHQQPEKYYSLTYIDGNGETQHTPISEDDRKDLSSWSRRMKEYCSYGVIGADEAEYVIKTILELKEVKPIPHNYVSRRLESLRVLTSQPDDPYISTDIYLDENKPLEIDDDQWVEALTYSELIENLAKEIKQAISAQHDYNQITEIVSKWRKEYAVKLENKKLERIISQHGDKYDEYVKGLEKQL